MNRNYLQLFALFLALSYTQPSFSQMLCPGDIINNGIVNGIDVLYAGVAFGESGPLRPAASENWQAQLLGELWAQNFPNGLNYAYADCDGDGIVGEDDISGTIENNFFLTHGTIAPDEYSNGNSANAPIIKLLAQNVNVGVGSTVVFDLWLGEDATPAQDFYGIAISLKYNPDFTLGSEWDFEEIENAWYDPTDDNSEDLLIVDDATGTIELAITSTKQQNINGAGKIGSFSFISEDFV